jgi:transposase
VHRAHRYEPDLNPSYLAMASHYSVAVIPARPFRPTDKAKVESGVLIVQRWILARLRNRQFFSLAELNAAISLLLLELNERAFQKLEGSRRSWFETVDKPAMTPLPREPYEFAQFRKARVNVDYHVEVEAHRYSVPYRLIRQEVEVKLAAATVEIFHNHHLVAMHARSFRKGGFTTNPGHRPASHKAHLEWTPERLTHWAASLGVACRQVVEYLIASRPHPEQAYRSCLGLFRLGRTYGDNRLEAACQRAVQLHAISYKSVAAMLKAGLDQQPLACSENSTPPILHDNVRGPGYFH